MVVSPVLNRWQSAAFWRIPYRPPAKDCKRKGNQGRKYEVSSPGTCDSEVGKQGNSSNRQDAEGKASEGMGDVPYTHLEAPFILAEPVGHNTPARRPAHTAEPSDHEHQDKDEGGVERNIASVRYESYRKHHQCRQHESQTEELA